jgi:hypothetical protein
VTLLLAAPAQDRGQAYEGCAASVETPSGGIGTPLLIAGVAVAVLVVGELGGLAPRRGLG